MAGLPVDGMQLRELLERVRARTGIPGIAAAIAGGDAVVLATAGTRAADTSVPFPRDSRFAIGCITKLLMATACLELARLGRMDLEAPLEEYVPDLKGSGRGRTQVLRHLLAHSSGYQEVAIESLAAGRWNEFAEADRLFDPGTVFSYEHTAYTAIGEVIRRTTGRDVETVVRGLLSERVGLSCGRLGEGADNVTGHDFKGATGEFVPIAVGPFPSNGAVSNLTLSVEELASLARAYAGGRMLPAAGAGSPDFADLLYAPQSTVPGRIEGTRPIGLPLSFGLGCARYCADMHGFDGGFRGQSSCIRFDRQRGLGIAIGVNVGSATVRSRVFEAIMQSIGFGADARSPNIRRSYDFDLARLPGTYRGVDRSSLIVSETPAGFDLDFQLAGYGTRFQASVGYDRKQNLPRVSGSAQLCGLAIFSEPNHQTPCVGVGVTAFRQQDRAAHA